MLLRSGEAIDGGAQRVSIVASGWLTRSTGWHPAAMTTLHEIRERVFFRLRCGIVLGKSLAEDDEFFKSAKIQ